MQEHKHKPSFLFFNHGGGPLVDSFGLIAILTVITYLTGCFTHLTQVFREAVQPRHSTHGSSFLGRGCASRNDVETVGKRGASFGGHVELVVRYLLARRRGVDYDGAA
jgi:hypothetical protein